MRRHHKIAFVLLFIAFCGTSRAQQPQMETQALGKVIEILTIAAVVTLRGSFEDFTLRPMSEKALRRGRTLNWVVRGLVAVGVAIAVAGLALGASPRFAWSGVGVGLSALLILVLAWPFVYVTGSIKDGWVWLSFAHPLFAREMGRVYGARATGA